MKSFVSKQRPRGGVNIWKGPIDDGISYSMLCMYLMCRERFRLMYVEGLRPIDRFSKEIEYGQMFHACEEANSGGHDWQKALKEYAIKIGKRYPLDQEDIWQWHDICLVQYPIYLDWWRIHPDEKSRKPVAQEWRFNTPYKLPSGRVVRIKGRVDAIDQLGKEGQYIRDTKTKGDIKESQIRQQLSFDLQMMMYMSAMSECQPVPKGFVYNLIRRPLSRGKGSISQRKGGRGKPAESHQEFMTRVGELIQGATGPDWEMPDGEHYYFMRFRVRITKGDVDKFRRECLDPLLEGMCEWWDQIVYSNDSHNSGNPFHAPMTGLHWRHPYGVYDPMREGWATDYDRYLASGDETGLMRITPEDLFTELK